MRLLLVYIAILLLPWINQGFISPIAMSLARTSELNMALDEVLVTQLEAMRASSKALSQRLSDSDVVGDPLLLRKIMSERAQYEKVSTVYEEYMDYTKELRGAKELLADESDPEMQEMAKSEVEAIESKMEKLEQDLRVLMLPTDPNDERNIMLEIRAGTGGSEASLFAGDLLDVYRKFIQAQGWTSTLVDESREGTGFKNVILAVKGESVFSKLKWEAGVHRVQRVPATETQGRVHTSTATVAIMPECDDVDVKIDPKDLDISTIRSGGAGGQVSSVYGALYTSFTD
eukprot:Nitzschia sp. Nitz4//scaffold45_size130396//79164//80094//NITZ4_003458-RA/size130396-augustus-gene-0.256-mRNA-1//-1//CDS//3329552425//5696//frame0